MNGLVRCDKVGAASISREVKTRRRQRSSNTQERDAVGLGMARGDDVVATANRLRQVGDGVHAEAKSAPRACSVADKGGRLWLRDLLREGERRDCACLHRFGREAEVVPALLRIELGLVAEVR